MSNSACMLRTTFIHMRWKLIFFSLFNVNKVINEETPRMVVSMSGVHIRLTLRVKKTEHGLHVFLFSYLLSFCAIIEIRHLFLKSEWHINYINMYLFPLSMKSNLPVTQTDLALPVPRWTRKFVDIFRKTMDVIWLVWPLCVHRPAANVVSRNCMHVYMANFYHQNCFIFLNDGIQQVPVLYTCLWNKMQNVGK